VGWLILRTSLEPKPCSRTRFLYSSIVVGTALLVCFDLVFRWQENRLIERRTRQEISRKQLEMTACTLEQLGGKELAIQSFYASPGAIHRGESVATLLWSGQRQKSETRASTQCRLASYAYCVNVSPAKNTTYTLTISDASGNTKTESLKVVSVSEARLRR